MEKKHHHIIVKDCKFCPFCVYSNMQVYCSITDKRLAENPAELRIIPESCPLREKSAIVTFSIK